MASTRVLQENCITTDEMKAIDFMNYKYNFFPNLLRITAPWHDTINTVTATVLLCYFSFTKHKYSLAATINTCMHLCHVVHTSQGLTLSDVMYSLGFTLL